jgi:glycosyltransferase 2 family protein
MSASSQAVEGRIGEIPQSPAPTAGSSVGLGKLAGGGVVFLLLTAAVFWYQFHRTQAGDATPRLVDLDYRFLALIALAWPVETLTSAMRIWLLCRVLQPGVSFWTAVQAAWANVAISMLTPSQSGGGPGQIYLLARGGASVGTALTISLLSFFGTMVGLLLLGLYSLLVAGTVAPGPLFAVAVWSLTGISAAMCLGALCPGPLRLVLAALSRAACRLVGRPGAVTAWWPPRDDRTGPPVDRMDRRTAALVDVVYTYRDDVVRCWRHGRATLLWVCLLSVVFLLARALMPYLCLRFLGIDRAGLGHVVEIQMALIFLVFFAPTPGGAGVAETASLSAMEAIVPAGFAPYYNLLWRFTTTYLAAIAGLVCLLRALAQDARRVARRRSPAGREE